MPHEAKENAQQFLSGKALRFEEANQLWQILKAIDELSLAREVLARIRAERGLLDELPTERALREELCREHALLVSKDPELSAAVQHDQALKILSQMFDLNDRRLDGDTETLGIAGGIYKRRWNELGQLDDLLKSAALYERGAHGSLGDDAYTQINAAFLADLLASLGVDAAANRQRAHEQRERIVNELDASLSWWNIASRAEALFGLKRYGEARQILVDAVRRPEPWRLQTMVRQLGTLARIHEARPLDKPDIRAVFDALLPGAAAAARSAVAGKVGLALSGGGFRASFYHLGLLARLAELDVLRHVEVLSCVSGGSIVGACYWLALRARMLDQTKAPMNRDDYVAIVEEVIERFELSVSENLRDTIEPSKIKALWRLRNDRGVLDPELAAVQLQKHFYGPLMPNRQTIYMHDLQFTPADFDAALAGSGDFNPSRHNWMRACKVPALILNATTVNTAHAWQFTPTWMGESPWAIHEAADSIPRLEWSHYEPGAGWQMELGRAVAASACVPGVFAPLSIKGVYPGTDVQLVDGGVHDNQGTVSLLAHNCNVLIVSDASGQLLLEEEPSAGIAGLGSYAWRAMNILMERVRLANYADLKARVHSGLLRGLMFMHMKAGLDADTRRLPFSHKTVELERTKLSPSGVRKDFQQALAELRTDLDAFTQAESRLLMACGYAMASSTFARDLKRISEIWEEPVGERKIWCFAEQLQEITSAAAATPNRQTLLNELRAGNKVKL